MRLSILLVGSFIVGCGDANPAEEGAVAVDGVAGDPFASVESGLKVVGQARAAGDHDLRRKRCMTLINELEGLANVDASQRKLEALAPQVRAMCGEMFETMQLVAADVARFEIPVSGLLASTFTSKALATTFRDARKIVKRGEDPSAECARVKIMAEHLVNAQKGRARKLAKKGLAYCMGRGALASARFHLRQAEPALSTDQSKVFSEHCVAAYKQLKGAASSKAHDELVGSAKALCLEAYALYDAAKRELAQR